MFTDAKIAGRNIWRNPARTLLTMAAIAFACLLLVFMLSFQFGSYEAMVNSSVKVRTGHFQVQGKGYNQKQNIRKTVDEPDRVARMLDGIKEVKAYAFRAEGFALVSSDDRTRGVLVTGIEPERESSGPALEGLVRSGSFFTQNDRETALLGELLAQHLRVDVGDELTLMGQGKNGSIAACVLTVKGIFSSGIDEFDRQAVYMPLQYFDSTFSMNGSVHTVVGVADSLSKVRHITRDLEQAFKPGEGLAVLDWKEMMPGLVQAIKMDLSSAVIFYIILVIVVAFSILNTFLMSILEREKEFGVMLAFGVMPARLLKLVLMESMALTFSGVAVGTAAGCVVTLWFQAHGIDLSGMSEILKEYGMSGRIYPSLSVLSALSGPAVVFLITVLSALYPAVKVKNIQPSEALKGM